ncbi:two-component sensor histidine kinase [Pigmentiphaga aceris]|uniref:histidine kinase n=1 Tax=Pigmentiphaga aceris TaxID=1940612 RepID=A0A5C0B1M7_9BURK|nr:ATP-binding protein [Pigmentiphaga aceris]QEI06547.1 two-component sensor histidine kinase [Pigmentiphaga aceris]
MSLQRRLIIAVLVAAPFAWLLTIGVTYFRAQQEINELYDTDMVRMAEHLYDLLDVFGAPPPGRVATAPPKVGDLGQAHLGDLAVAAWLPDGRALRIDPDGDPLPRQPGVQGFTNTDVENVTWRVYYLENSIDASRVAVGQRLGEREELVSSYLLGQILPWLFALPLLLLMLVGGVRQALKPVNALSMALERRNPNDPVPIDPSLAPGELRPLVVAMNRLLGRVASAIEHERRLTADAAHELRTPLAALHVQWEVAQRAVNVEERAEADAKVALGIQRLNRLVSQLLAMSRLESGTKTSFSDTANWPEISGHALSDSLWLATSKQVDVELFWPDDGIAPLPLTGDEHLLGLMLRNLLDNAIRYSPPGGMVAVHFKPDGITLTDQGTGVPPDLLARLGDRFFRAPGQQESGSGLGLSIAKRVASMHGLSIAFANLHQDGKSSGFQATISRLTTG